VADGRTKIPQESISYYNVNTKKYEKCVTPEITLEYVGKEVSSSAGTSRAVDMTNPKGMKLIKLRFAPFEEAQVIGMDTFGAGKPEISDCCGEWIRVKSSSSLIGWVRMSELGLKGNDL
jgi:SH3-like domain-containing protein